MAHGTGRSPRGDTPPSDNPDRMLLLHLSEQARSQQALIADLMSRIGGTNHPAPAAPRPPRAPRPPAAAKGFGSFRSRGAPPPPGIPIPPAEAGPSAAGAPPTSRPQASASAGGFPPPQSPEATLSQAAKSLSEAQRSIRMAAAAGDVLLFGSWAEVENTTFALWTELRLARLRGEAGIHGRSMHLLSKIAIVDKGSGNHLKETDIERGEDKIHFETKHHLDRWLSTIWVNAAPEAVKQSAIDLIAEDRIITIFNSGEDGTARWRQWWGSFGSFREHPCILEAKRVARMEEALRTQQEEPRRFPAVHQAGRHSSAPPPPPQRQAPHPRVTGKTQREKRAPPLLPSRLHWQRQGATAEET